MRAAAMIAADKSGTGYVTREQQWMKAPRLPGPNRKRDLAASTLLAPNRPLTWANAVIQR
jgi:hypothetical protein